MSGGVRREAPVSSGHSYTPCLQLMFQWFIRFIFYTIQRAAWPECFCLDVVCMYREDEGNEYGHARCNDTLVAAGTCCLSAFCYVVGEKIQTVEILVRLSC